MSRIKKEAEKGKNHSNNAERCICCGNVIPEGRQVCYQCERSAISNGYRYHPPKKRLREKMREIIRILKE